MTTKTAATDHPVHALIAERWSPYAFGPESVADDDLRSVFEAARWAASSYNEQPWHYIVAKRDDADEFEKLLSALVEPNQAWAKAAPVLALGVVSKNFKRNGKPNKAAVHDLGLARALAHESQRESGPLPRSRRSFRPRSVPKLGRPSKRPSFRSS